MAEHHVVSKQPVIEILQRILTNVRKDACKHCCLEKDTTFSHDSVYVVYCGVLEDVAEALALLEAEEKVHAERIGRMEKALAIAREYITYSSSDELAIQREMDKVLQKGKIDNGSN